jgi:hypothetical protein
MQKKKKKSQLKHSQPTNAQLQHQHTLAQRNDIFLGARYVLLSHQCQLFGELCDLSLQGLDVLFLPEA